jgi:hypothetical protein
MTALNRRDNIWSSVEGPVSSDGDIVCVKNKRSNPSLPLLSQSERVRYFENARSNPRRPSENVKIERSNPSPLPPTGPTLRKCDRTRGGPVRPTSSAQIRKIERSNPSPLPPTGPILRKMHDRTRGCPVRPTSSARIRQNRTFEPEPPPASNAGQRRARASCEIRCIIDGLP